MLLSLQIKDYALIENINVEFGKGLNIITGETGAGKSILIDALGLILGNRAVTEVVRKGAQKSIIEGIFNVHNNKKVEKLLTDNEIEFLDELIVRREVSVKGSNRCFLNDTPVQLSVIKEVGELLVDLHGQHEHQSLLRTETHIEMLDDMGDYENLILEYRDSIAKLNQKISILNDFRKKEKSLKEKNELYEYQIKEIDSVSPIENEDDEIENELNILENAERLLELTTGIYDRLYDSEESIYDALGHIKNDIEQLTSIDKSFSPIDESFESVLSVLGEISENVRSYRDKIDLDPERLETMRERLTSIKSLIKKYGGSLKSVINHRAKIGEEFEFSSNFDEKIKDIEFEINKLRESSGETAVKISSERKKVAKKIKSEIEAALKNLGISDAVFEVRFATNSPINNTERYLLVQKKHLTYDENGIDEVEFYISTNIGEDPKPLAKVASGGEVSRIMLSLKTVLAKNDKLPLLIFDEIDTGVSGRIAQKVGETLKSLSEFHQIIAITHLPQIAALSNNHYAVLKTKVNDRVVSSLRILGENEKIEEVAKLMSGDQITEAALKGAKELMGL